MCIYIFPLIDKKKIRWHYFSLSSSNARDAFGVDDDFIDGNGGVACRVSPLAALFNVIELVPLIYEQIYF